MMLKDLVTRVRQNTRDTTGSLFTQEDVLSFINEGVDRMRSLKKLSLMKSLENLTEEPLYLPEQYHYLISLYATSRCFTQDEQVYQAEQFMNEFEFKLSELDTLINNGTVVIEGLPPEFADTVDEYVINLYFTKNVGD